LNTRKAPRFSFKEDIAMNTCPPDKTRIARDILDLVIGQPDSEDTLEGILRRYYPGTPSNRERTLVQEVVGDLVTQGLLEKVQREDRALYRARPKR
jgi:coenzyme F420-reducing hydrogenase gamma subunit